MSTYFSRPQTAEDCPTASQLKAGDAYANDGGYLVRYIHARVGGRIAYCDFGWPDARLFSPMRTCTPNVFARWAVWKLSPEEVARLPITEAEAEIERRVAEQDARVTAAALADTEDDELLAECRARGILPQTEPQAVTPVLPSPSPRQRPVQLDDPDQI